MKRAKLVLLGVCLLASVSLSQSFSVLTPAAAKIAGVVLIRTSSTTHSLNTDQHSLELEFQRISEGEFLVQAPARPDLPQTAHLREFTCSSLRNPARGCHTFRAAENS